MNGAGKLLSRLPVTKRQNWGWHPAGLLTAVLQKDTESPGSNEGGVENLHLRFGFLSLTLNKRIHPLCPAHRLWAPEQHG